MVINSIPFWIFFVVLLVPYWWASARKSIKGQNLVLLIASYYFYAQASWKMCFLLAVATLIFYGLGIAIERYNRKNTTIASRLTMLGVVLGVGLLVYYKFLDFFIDEFASLLQNFGLHTNLQSFGIIMPLGISFFTFKLIAYVIEVHRENIKASRDIIDFGVYVSFFPTILSGPIDRPKEFLGQLQSVRRLDYDCITTGLKHVIWGMFLKMCIADRLADYTNPVLGGYESYSGTSLLIATFLYSFNMYCDFCGYTEMSIGVSKILGINIRPNFKRPFLAQNVAEYWRRWHMSLTTWLTDYCFMPLCVAFRDLGKYGLYLATIINLVLVGFWHGANWTYGLFGLYHGLLLVVVTTNEKKRKKFEKKYDLKNKWYYIVPRTLLTFSLITIGLLVFQSASVSDSFEIIKKIMYNQDFSDIYCPSRRELLYSLLFIFVVFIREVSEEYIPKLQKLYEKQYVRWCIYYILCFSILFFGLQSEGTFIYVQF